MVFQLPDKLKNNDNNPTVTYELGETIRNKILNYKEVFNSIYVDEDVSFWLSTVQYDFADSSFCDPYNKHKKLRKLLTKGSN